MTLNKYKIFKIIFLNLQDFLILISSVYISYSLRFENLFNFFDVPIIIYLYPTLVFLIIFNFSNFYYFLTRYFSEKIIISFFKSFFLYFLIFMMGVFFLNNIETYNINISTKFSEKIPQSFIIIQPLILIFLIIINRFFIFLVGSFLKNNINKKSNFKKKIIIYGAGDLGLQTLNFLKNIKKILMLFIF